MSIRILLIALVCLANRLNAQCVPKTVSLANFKTVSGTEIKNCIIGYSTLGKLNIDKSNVVLWPTWITGKSEEICNKIVPLLIDTTGLYIIVVDAFGNGISSSPSNTTAFPEITIRDMVNSQYELLTKYFLIRHLKVLIGVSMGGMQVLEWITSYPDFADYAVSIVGSPKLSSYDLMLWKTEAALLSTSTNEKSMELAMRMTSNVNLLNLYTPSYWQHNAKQEKADSVLLSSKTDLLVNPQSSVDLAKAIGTTLLELDNDCGHNFFMCDQALVKETVIRFLR